MIKIVKNGKVLDYKEFIFPGGEVGIKLNANDYNFRTVVPPQDFGYTTIIARIQKSEDFFKLAMVVDALRKFDKSRIKLFLPYLPYARQDRVCDKGESFSLQVFCKLLNSLNFQKVVICDPHSEVAPALIENVEVISQFDIINKWLKFTDRARNCVLVAPDAGSNKKTAEVAKYFEHSSFVRADKLRDLSTGNIKETIVYCDDFKGRDACVIDDICDGGRTFIELAKVCKAKNCGKFVLYVTHGIFSKGVAELFNNGIDEIWATDSCQENLPVNLLKLEEKFL